LLVLGRFRRVLFTGLKGQQTEKQQDRYSHGLVGFINAYP